MNPTELAPPPPVLPQAKPRPRCPRLWLGIWHLVRPRILATVLFTMLVAALVAARQVPSWSVLFHAHLGASLVIAGALALNQRIEHRSDARMARTARRPLPAGLLSPHEATAFGLLATLSGLLYLVWAVNISIALVSLASWIIYVWMYTPMKMLSAWQTPLGAIAGAAPILMGAAAAGATWSVPSLTLFGILYFWQFPHAMAIAWLYRDDFAAAHVRVASVVDPSGRTAAAVSLLGAGLLVPVSLLPAWAGTVGWGYTAAAAVLGFGYLAPAVAFAFHRDTSSARHLLRASFLYLPAACLALLTASLLGLFR